MEHMIIKREENSNGEMLLYYVADDEGNQHGTLTTIERIEQINGEESKNEIVIGDLTRAHQKISLAQSSKQFGMEKWSNDEIKKLLIFYIDNKESFLNCATSKKHLWTVACKTMLIGKNVNSCEAELINLKKKYADVRKEQIKGRHVVWTLYDVCHKAFHNDDYVIGILCGATQEKKHQIPYNKSDGTIAVKTEVSSRTIIDENVKKMLQLYCDYKKKCSKEQFRKFQKTMWEHIASELAEENSEYWQKRFYNFKQHYIKMLEKRDGNSGKNISWPYMKVFDEIFESDDEFQSKYGPKFSPPDEMITDIKVEINNDWNITEMTVLVKYYFDCFYEFQDPTIPNKFLWAEVGRLLDRSAEDCKNKYDELKKEHLNRYINGVYDIKHRIPVAILFDNIICKEVQIQFANKYVDRLDIWNNEDIDALVQYFYENIILFKDMVCHFVCWAAASLKLAKKLESCRIQWNIQTKLYNSILQDKKDNPDLQIDWRYIELFDRIFDYGMDTKLLKGYPCDTEQSKPFEFIRDKKPSIKEIKEHFFEFENETRANEPRTFAINTKYPNGDPKAFKILTYYLQNKEKFTNSHIKKIVLWQKLSPEVGLTAEQCAHRLRNMKQLFTSYVKRELTNPEKPIIWPYFTLCKKVFGYRAVKNKLKKKESDDEEDWTAKEIKQLLNYFDQNFYDINRKNKNKSKWKSLARSIGKSESSCDEKFFELRKSYMKIKSMKARNPNVKITWKYYDMIDKLYDSKNITEGSEDMQIDGEPTNNLPDEDYQCIIVIPEGEELTDISKAKIIIKNKEAISHLEAIENNTEDTIELPFVENNSAQLLIVNSSEDTTLHPSIENYSEYTIEQPSIENNSENTIEQPAIENNSEDTIEQPSTDNNLQFTIQQPLIDNNSEFIIQQTSIENNSEDTTEQTSDLRDNSPSKVKAMDQGTKITVASGIEIDLVKPNVDTNTILHHFSDNLVTEEEILKQSNSDDSNVPVTVFVEPNNEVFIKE